MKFVFLTLLVVLVSCLEAKTIPVQEMEHIRNINDLIINQLGLGNVWDTIQQLGNGFVAQIMSEGMALVFAGQEKLKLAQAVFNNLVDQLTNHGIQTAQTAANMVKEAIKQVSAILSNSKFNKIIYK